MRPVLEGAFGIGHDGGGGERDRNVGWNFFGGEKVMHVRGCFGHLGVFEGKCTEGRLIDIDVKARYHRGCFAVISAVCGVDMKVHVT